MAQWVKVRRDDEKLEVGDIIEHYKYGEMKLEEYYYNGYDKCPKCKSKNTYHITRIKKDVMRNNVFMFSDWCELPNGETYHTLNKMDACLKCGNMWVAQLFVWKLLNPKEEYDYIWYWVFFGVLAAIIGVLLGNIWIGNL